jgi:hypothetical protein
MIRMSQKEAIFSTTVNALCQSYVLHIMFIINCTNEKLHFLLSWVYIYFLATYVSKENFFCSVIVLNEQFFDLGSSSDICGSFMCDQKIKSAMYWIQLKCTYYLLIQMRLQVLLHPEEYRELKLMWLYTARNYFCFLVLQFAEASLVKNHLLT